MLTLMRSLLLPMKQTVLALEPQAQEPIDLKWRLINAELGLSAWVARATPVGSADGAAAALLALVACDDQQSPRTLACQLASAHPHRLVVLPLFQPERLATLGVPHEVALHTLVQRLRYEACMGPSQPSLVCSRAMHWLAQNYASRYRAADVQLLHDCHGGSGTPAAERAQSAGALGTFRLSINPT